MRWDSTIDQAGQLPHQPGLVSAFSRHRERQLRVRVFLFSFLITALAALSWTWLRPAVYQSDAVLSVVYEQQGTPVQQAFLSEQLVIHRQRLLGRQLLAQLRAELPQTQLQGEQASLSERLEVRILDDSRLLQLSVSGNQPEQLEPVLSRWIDLYLARFRDERASAARDQQQALKQQLAEMESRLQVRRRQLEAFKEEHQIVSIERDENRALSKIKALGASLDSATEAQAEASSRLSAIRRAVAAGQTVVRPQDQAGIDQLHQRAQALEEELRDYAEQYTEAYMAIDTNVQAIRRKLQLLKEKISARRTQSLQRHLQEAERDLATAREKAGKLKVQLDGLQGQVRIFSNRMQSFAAQKEETEQLNLQAQSLRSQLIEQEVSQPYQSRVRLLEPPYRPDRPLSPDYWRDSGYSLIGALGVATLAVLLFNLLNPGNRPEILVTGNDPQPPGLERAVAGSQLPGAQLRLQEPGLQEPGLHEPGLQEPGFHEPGFDESGLTRPNQNRSVGGWLSAQQCRQLMDHAEPTAALATGLLLSGLQPGQLLNLRWQDVDFQAGGIRTEEHPEHLLLLGKGLLARLNLQHGVPQAYVCQDARGTPLQPEGLDSLLSCAAYDAGLSDPQGISAERLFDTYLGFLAEQQLSSEGLYQRLGQLPEVLLDKYQQRLPGGPLRALEQVQPFHPATG